MQSILVLLNGPPEGLRNMEEGALVGIGNSLMHYAITKSLTMICILLDKGYKYDENSGLAAPLIEALRMGSEHYKLLLKWGAPNYDINGLGAIMLATGDDSITAVELKDIINVNPNNLRYNLMGATPLTVVFTYMISNPRLYIDKYNVLVSFNDAGGHPFLDPFMVDEYGNSAISYNINIEGI